MNNNRNDSIYSYIGFRIYTVRNSICMSQEALALKCDLERTSIVHIEKGRQRVPIDRLYIIAKALGVNAKDLLPDSNEISNFDPISHERVSSETVEKINKILYGLKKSNKVEE